MSGSIIISGAGTVLFLLEDLWKDFQEKHPGVSFNILPSSHTTGGIEGTRERILDIGAISRRLNSPELGPELNAYYFCKDIIVFITHPDVSVKSITKNQIMDIYRGKIKDWQEIGGKPGKIIAIRRPDTAGSMKVLLESFFEPGFTFSQDIISIESSTDAILAVCQTKNTILFISSSFATSKDYPVNVLTIDGMPISNSENIISGKYPLARTFGVVYRKDPPTHISAFIEYLKGENAHNLILKHGCFPLS